MATQLTDRIKDRLRPTPIWPVLRFGKRCVLSGLNWAGQNNPISCLRDRFSKRDGQFLTSHVRTLQLPLQEDTIGGWAAYGIFDGSTRNVGSLASHASVLSAGKMPHEPHVHAEEEILIMLSGQAELVIVDSEQGSAERRERVQPGSFVYYPAGHCHTIHNPGSGIATYLMLKWKSQEIENSDALDMSIVRLPQERKPHPHPDTDGFATAPFLDSGTKYLRKLHCHMTTLEPGCGYPPHADPYEVVIIVLSGTVETLGEKVGPNGVIFYAADSPHGMKNPGTSPAVYLVFEFHGRYSTLR